MAADRLWLADLVAYREFYERSAETAACTSYPETTKAPPRLHAGQARLHESDAPPPPPYVPPRCRIAHSCCKHRISCCAFGKLAQRFTLTVPPALFEVTFRLCEDSRAGRMCRHRHAFQEPNVMLR